ncbi:uncharacterized protein LOC111244112 isoform X1 [Varroa destructor]|uniref:Heparan sulfate glucosamine 3-O-sulfotransferase 5 n=2 Tax=Varroa destructor TaxID=109461 RepID=A0A7M7JDZ6_VARDE|nr:uncharacterized protein LOC111244112 isoform X1 [Varroa destructor]XP_022646518.1 uncharacterized protein LOC111244112 isoform X1 [Varroa destructor]XP_022646519.1 uncharacterized protein LOC111244112 isoform X1 [Varroa destructor]
MAYQQARRLFLLALSATCFVLLHVLLLQQQPMPPSPDYTTRLSIGPPLTSRIDVLSNTFYVPPASPPAIPTSVSGSESAAASGGGGLQNGMDIGARTKDSGAAEGLRAVDTKTKDSNINYNIEKEDKAIVENRSLLQQSARVAANLILPKDNGVAGSSNAYLTSSLTLQTKSLRQHPEDNFRDESSHRDNMNRISDNNKQATQATPTPPLNESVPASVLPQVGSSTGVVELPLAVDSGGSEGGIESVGVSENSSAINAIAQSSSVIQTTIPPLTGGVKRLPQCIIIGARKGGTRALLEFLNLHPAIEKATDEVHFFDDDSKYRLGLDWYRTRMPSSTAEQITIEKSPAYFVTDRVPERMWAMNSSLRLLLIVRDPVVRLISDYAQLAENRRMRRESAHKDSKNKVPQFEQVVLTAEGRVNTDYRPVGTSIYAVYFRRWLAYFPRRQIHVIDGDRLVREPFPEVQKVEAFLGLEARIPEEVFYFNKTKGFYCVRTPDDVQDHCLNESKGRKHPKVAPAVISRLREFYAPFNREFYSLVGHDFGWPEL